MDQRFPGTRRGKALAMRQRLHGTTGVLILYTGLAGAVALYGSAAWALLSAVR